jgi:hypothetical protein
MKNREYVDYLNSLHNYNAQNKNAYGERSIGSIFFEKVMVKIGLVDYILKKLNSNQPQIIILTGHAGDGKTSIMYQVVKELCESFDSEAKITDIRLKNGANCKCIKDFSEFSDDDKLKILSEVVGTPQSGNFVFMVSNTGPLINTFGKLFIDPEESDRAVIELIEAMDSNNGDISNIRGHDCCIINVAELDNTYFAAEFLDRLIVPELWDDCRDCEKSEYCHIFNNRNLIEKNRDTVFRFISMHYIWLTEHGQRLTIRSMAEQLAFMITGGLSCNNIKNNDQYQLLFCNLFFGYFGTRENIKARGLVAIEEANKCGYYKRRLRADEILLVNREYNSIFGMEISDIIIKAEKKDKYISGWPEFLRRSYLFMNIVTDEIAIKQNVEDIFSKNFERYIELKNGNSSPSRLDIEVIIDALSMIFMGVIHTSGEIPITLSKESGIAQNVQLVTGQIPTRKMSIYQKPTKDGYFHEGKERFELRLKINDYIINCKITLPMLNFFEELKNGIIPTNIDPQLSHGVENLKAQLAQLFIDDDDELIEMVVLRNNGNESIRLEIDNNNKIRHI